MQRKFLYVCLSPFLQVYIVAVKQDQDKDTISSYEEEEFAENSGESLLTLVQAELPTLSQNWFYALKDHALLSLPHGKIFLLFVF